MAEVVEGDAPQFWTALTFQIRSYLRTWRFLGLMLFVVGVSVAVLAVDIYRGSEVIKATSPTASAFLATYLGNVPTAIAITAAFLGGDTLAVDLAGGPGYLMLTLPVRRRTLLAGRYAAAALTGFAIALAYYAFAVAGSLWFYGTVPSVVLVSMGCAFLFGLAALGLAFLFSSFFRTPAVAVISSVLILILAFPIVTAIGTITGAEPWFSLDYGAGIISNVFSSNFQHEKVSQIQPGGPTGPTITLYQWSAYLPEGVVIILVYLAVSLALTYVIYRYKEVKG